MQGYFAILKRALEGTDLIDTLKALEKEHIEVIDELGTVQAYLYRLDPSSPFAHDGLDTCIRHLKTIQDKMRRVDL